MNAPNSHKKVNKLNLLFWQRLCLYVGLALHFAPSLLWYHENYAADAFRTTRYGFWLHAQIGDAPLFPTLAACLLLLVGTSMVFAWSAWRRLGHTLVLLGLYLLCSVSSLYTSSLSVQAVFGVLAAMALFDTPRAYLQMRIAIVAFLATSMFCAGLEKFSADWWQNNEMYVFLASPTGYITQPWAEAWAKANLDLAWVLGQALSVLTVLFQWLSPPLLLFKKTRLLGVIFCAGFFAAILVTFQVPLLFPLLYLPGFALALDKNYSTNT